MPAYVGLSQYLYINSATYGSPTWGAVPIVKDCKIPMAADEADVSTRGNGGWKASKQALKSMSFEFQIVYDPGAATFETLRDAFLNGTALDLWASDLAEDAEDAQGPRAVCEVFKFDKSENLGDPVMVDVVAKPTYSANPPAWHEGSGGGGG